MFLLYLNQNKRMITSNVKVNNSLILESIKYKVIMRKKTLDNKIIRESLSAFLKMFSEKKLT